MGEQSGAAQSRRKKLISVSERRGILPLEGLVDTLRPICMSITPAENGISALRLSGAVALNIAREAEHWVPPGPSNESPRRLVLRWFKALNTNCRREAFRAAPAILKFRSFWRESNRGLNPGDTDTPHVDPSPRLLRRPSQEKCYSVSNAPPPFSVRLPLCPLHHN